MEEMRDSTAIAGNAEALLEEIRTEGYVLIRGLVDADAAAAVGHDIRTVVAKHGFSRYEDGLEEVLRTPKKFAEPPEYWRMYSDVLALESMNALPHKSDRLRATMHRILGPTAFTYPQKTVRLVFPQANGGAAIPVHRDNRGGPWVQDMFTSWVALGQIDALMGGFAMLRGSQTYNYQALQEEGERPADAHGLPIPDMDSPDWVTTEWQPGDVVIFHCFTAHRGIYNRTGKIRVSVDYRWQATDHPVQISVLLPYHYLDRYPSIPGWSALTEGWSDHRWCEYPKDVEVCQDKWPADRGYELPPSRFVTVEPGALEAWRSAIRDKSIYKVPLELPN